MPLTWLDCIQSPYWEFKLKIKLLAHTSFRFHLGIFTKWCSSTFCRVIYTVNHVTKRLGRRLRATRDLPGRFGSWFTVKITWQNIELHHLVKIPRWNRMLVCAKSLIWSLKPRLCYLETSYWKKWTIERNIYTNMSKCLVFYFILLDPQKSNKKGKVPRKMLQTQVRPGLSVLA